MSLIRNWRNRLLMSVLAGLMVAAAVTAAIADKSKFQLIVVNTGQTISCDKLRLDPGSFRCKRGDMTYKYDADVIESVVFNGESIYPYDDSIQLTETDLYAKDCDFLIQAIKSPLILEHNPDIFILVGTMYEKGICTRQNIQQAYTYYRMAGEPGMRKYNDLRRRSG